MNIYFLVEGKSEEKIYTKWLSYLIPQLQKVERFDSIIQNNYYIFNTHGYPALLKHLVNAIHDINSIKGKYDYLVICFDADEQDSEECKKEVLDFLIAEKVTLKHNTQLEIIIQNKCIETWFLGNSKIFKKNPTDNTLSKYIKFYNVKDKDPELMNKIPDFEGTVSAFHFDYLKKLLVERKMHYHKENPKCVMEKDFLEKLVSRAKNTQHIRSFKYFIDFCTKISSLLKNED